MKFQVGDKVRSTWQMRKYPCWFGTIVKIDEMNDEEDRHFIDWSFPKNLRIYWYSKDYLALMPSALDKLNGIL